MSILAWIEDQKRLKLLNAPKYVNPTSDSSKGLWTRCDKCGVILYIKHLRENQRVCFGCGYHLQMSSQERVETLLDKDSWRPFDETVSPCDPLLFYDQRGYTDRLQDAQERTGLQDAIQTGTGMVDGIPVALGVMDFDFMGGSMGSVVGEKITRLIEYATQEGLPLLLVSASGGARMQEGVFSLMQMAKISSALHIYQSCANLLYISILTSPTTGGVTASFAMLGDIIFAEPKALIAFAGRRVIEQTLCEDLPEDFQTSEYMLHHGLLDLIIPRRFLRQALSESIRLYKNAPFKRHGRIPFGVQNPISFVAEEKLRRQFAKRGGRLSNQDTLSSTHLKDAHTQQEALTEVEAIEDRTSERALSSPAAINPPAPDSNRQTRRESNEYRHILTSFETMFHLLSNQMLLLDSYGLSKVDMDHPEEGIRDGSTASRLASLRDEVDPPKGGMSNRLRRAQPALKKEGIHALEKDPQAALGSLEENVISRLATRHSGGDLNRLSFLEQFQSLAQEQYPRDGTIGLSTAEDGRSPLREDQISMIDIHSSDSDSTDCSNMPNSSNDILHQALDLAAAESIEWRAFYIHQRIAQTAGFVDNAPQTLHPSLLQKRDALPRSLGLPSKHWGLTIQNSLLYRAISQGDAYVHARVTPQP